MSKPRKDEEAAPRKKPSVTKGAGGRPSTYSDEIASEILHRLSNGEALRQITKDSHMPVMSTVYQWLMRKPEFSNLYVRAREEQADTLADEIVHLSDESPVQVVDDKGVARIDSAWVTWQKNRVDARKWVASKLKPKKYGERTTVAGDADSPLKVDVDAKGLFDSILQSIELKKKQEGLESE